jgi:hypothetical protein
VSETAIFDTSLALKRRLEEAVMGGVYVGPPVRTEMGDRGVALFLFHIEPNRDLRNTPRYAPPAPGPASAANPELNSIALDLRFLIAVFRTAVPGGGGDPDELLRIGQIVRHLHANPVLGDAALAGQTVRVTPEPHSIDELSRIWDVFQAESYQTSMVYLATPVWVDAGFIAGGPPVQSSRISSGLSADPQRLFAETVP